MTHVLLLSTLLVATTNSLCNYFYDGTALVPLDVCSYSKEGFSSGYYCRDHYNESNESQETYVIQIVFDRADCPDNRGEIAQEIKCSWPDCNCHGVHNECNIARIQRPCNGTANESYYNVWDICIGRGNLGGQFFECHELGIVDKWYTNSDCSGVIAIQSSHEQTQCQYVNCDRAPSIKHLFIPSILILFCMYFGS
eukprot:468528_1